MVHTMSIATFQAGIFSYERLRMLGSVRGLPESPDQAGTIAYNHSGMLLVGRGMACLNAVIRVSPGDTVTFTPN